MTREQFETSVAELDRYLTDVKGLDWGTADKTPILVS
jgi:hypothetical protein